VTIVALAAGGAAGFAVLAVALPRRPPPARPVAPAGRGAGAGGGIAIASGPALARARHARVALATLATLATLVVAPPLAVVPALVVWARTRAQRARATRRAAAQIADALPDAVDLLLLCTSAGWSLPMAHPEVAARLSPPLADALRAAATAAARGQPRAQALLDALSPLGERAHALAHILADHLHYGVALAPGLERLSLELRLDRRRRAEVEARRVPVRLLAPLVVCVLPAFALLTVVPLLVASLRALPT
jgi:Flp pilus assembly protein TadB